LARLKRLTVVALVSLVGACDAHDAPVTRASDNAISRAKAAAARGEPISPSAKIDSSPKPGEGLPYPGTWTPTTTYEDSLFTIERPSSSMIEGPSTERTYDHANPDVVIGRLPDCKWSCTVSISVWRDVAGGGVRALVLALTAPDTAQDADIAPVDATIIDSLPLGRDAAVHLEMSCGDCGSHAILTSYHGWMARIEYSSDDREGYTPAVTAHLAAMARSFRWRK
jgi:hypothetical protein